MTARWAEASETGETAAFGADAWPDLDAARCTWGAWPETKATDVIARHTPTTNFLYTDPSANVLTLNKPRCLPSQAQSRRKRRLVGRFFAQSGGMAQKTLP